MKPRLIVFDLDGTLVEFPFTHLFDTTERVLLGMGQAVARADIGLGFAEFEYFRIVEASMQHHFAAALSQALDWKSYPPVEVFPHTIDCLSRLRSAGYELALATSRDSPVEELVRQLEHTEIISNFNNIAVRIDSSLDWSDKGPQLHHLSRQTGIPLAEMMMVGDNPRDISSAKQAGVGFTAALESGGIRPEVLARENPRWQFPGLKELTNCVLAL